MAFAPSYQPSRTGAVAHPCVPSLSPSHTSAVSSWPLRFCRISRGMAAPSLSPTFVPSYLPPPPCHHSLFSTSFLPPTPWTPASSSPLLPSLSRRPLSVAAVASTVQESVAEALQHVPKKPDAPPERERVELPTNDSSETLLKIRHTVCSPGQALSEKHLHYTKISLCS